MRVCRAASVLVISSAKKKIHLLTSRPRYENHAQAAQPMARRVLLLAAWGAEYKGGDKVEASPTAALMPRRLPPVVSFRG